MYPTQNGTSHEFQWPGAVKGLLQTFPGYRFLRFTSLFLSLTVGPYLFSLFFCCSSFFEKEGKGKGDAATSIIHFKLPALAACVCCGGRGREGGGICVCLCMCVFSLVCVCCSFRCLLLLATAMSCVCVSLCLLLVMPHSCNRVRVWVCGDIYTYVHIYMRIPINIVDAVAAGGRFRPLSCMYNNLLSYF